MHSAHRPNLLLVLVGVFFWFSPFAWAQETSPVHPSKYLRFIIAPTNVVPEPPEFDREVALHLGVQGKPPQICVDNEDGDEVCFDPDRPPIWGTWDVRTGPVGSAVIGPSCSGPRTDIANPIPAQEFYISPDNNLLFDLMALTLCADEFEEEDELFEFVLTLSLSEDLSNPFRYQLGALISDGTVRRDIPVFFGGHDTAHPRLRFIEDDLGDPCRPLEVLVSLSQPDNEKDTLLRFGMDLVSGGAELDKDFRFEPPFAPVIPQGDRGARFTLGCIIGDDIPEPTELFNIWVELAGEAWTRTYATVEIVDDEIQSHIPGFLTFEVGAAGGFGSYPEGNEETSGLPIVVRYQDGQLRSEALEFRLVTIDGTAVAGQDYHAIDETVIIPPGNAGVFDLGDQFRLRLIPDLVPEAAVEVFYVAVYAFFGAEKTPYFSEVLPVEVADDDFFPDLLDGSASIWFGSRPAGCPTVFTMDLPEPAPADGPFIDYSLDLFARMFDTGSDTALCEVSAETFSVEPSLHSGGAGSVAPAIVGEDISFSVRDPFPLVFRPLDHTSTVVVRVYSDDNLEPDEGATLRLSLGIHGYVGIRLRIVDFQKGQSLLSGRNASLVRMGRMMATMIGDGLQDRFSCARAKGCRSASSGTGAAASGLRRMASVFGSFTHGSFSGGGPGPAGAAPAAGPLHSAGSLSAANLNPHRPLLDVVGPRLDGLSYQVSPSAWFGTRNESAPTRWSAWMRTDYLHTSDANSDGAVQRASMLGMFGGIDRRVGIATFGTVYGWAWADYARRYGPALAQTEPAPADGDAFSNAASWQFLAPYVAVHPHDLLRGWVSFGRTIAGSWTASPGYQPDVERLAGQPGYQFYVAGASLTAVRFSRLVVDLEADTFSVGTSFRTCDVTCLQRATLLGDIARDDPGLVAAGDLAGGGLGVDLTAVGDGLPSGPVAQGLISQALRQGYDIGVEQVDLPSAVRRRLSVRLGVPFGAGTGSNLAVVVSRRWDMGPDIDWLLGHAGGVHAYDVGFDLRLSGARSRFSASLSGRMEVRSSSVVRSRELVHRERSLGGSLRWGAVETSEGWSVVLRPRYGYPGPLGSLQDGAMAQLIPVLMPTLDPSPFVDLEAGYGFGDGSRLVLSGSRGFAEPALGGPALGAGVNYTRGW